jgi:hypothetical protein
MIDCRLGLIGLGTGTLGMVQGGVAPSVGTNLSMIDCRLGLITLPGAMGMCRGTEILVPVVRARGWDCIVAPVTVPPWPPSAPGRVGLVSW